MSDPQPSAPALPAPRSAGAPIPGEDRAAGLAPFGLGRDKPHHGRALVEALWESRDELGHAWRVLTRGVCDRCALGCRGLRDDVVGGLQLCPVRLRTLPDHARPPLVPADVLNLDRLRSLDAPGLRALGRLPTPFLHEAGDRGFRRLSWEDALALAGDRIAAAGPEGLGVVATGRGLAVETTFALTRVAALLGTTARHLSALPDPTAGLRSTLGLSTATCSLGDLIEADLVLLVGANPGRDQPVLQHHLVAAKARGARIVVVDPARPAELEVAWDPGRLRSAVLGTRLMDELVQVAPGGDAAFLEGVLKALLARGHVDTPWLEAHTTGAPALAAVLADRAWADLEQGSGVSQARMEWAAELFGRARRVVTLYGPGLVRGGGTPAVERIAALHLLRGMIGRPGCGILPLVGGIGDAAARAAGMAPTSLAQLAAAPPAVLYAVGEGLLDGLEADRTAEALSAIDLRIHQGPFLDPSHLVAPGEAVLLLPAQTPYEQADGATFATVDRRLRCSPPLPTRPVGEARAPWRIAAQLAAAAAPEQAEDLDWADAHALRSALERAWPWARGIGSLRTAGDWVQWGGPHLGAGGRFPGMPDERARLPTLDPQPETDS